jgi:hypothetical protein
MNLDPGSDCYLPQLWVYPISNVAKILPFALPGNTKAVEKGVKGKIDFHISFMSLCRKILA